MKFYSAAARVILVAMALGVAFVIIGGIAIIAFALADTFNLDRSLAVAGALGGFPVWAAFAAGWRWVSKWLR